MAVKKTTGKAKTKAVAKTVKKTAPKRTTTKKRAKAIVKSTTITEKQIIEWMDMTGLTKQLQDHEKTQFVRIAMAYKLNPLKKEIFCNVYNANDPDRRTLSIVIGYQSFIKRAERLKLLDGWNCVTVKEDDDLKAVCTIYRKDWKFPFVYPAWYKECVQTTKQGIPNSFWRKMPKFMLRKVCTAQAFRLCFPDEDLPYIQEEWPEDREYADPINVTQTEKEPLKELTYTGTKEEEKEKKPLAGKDKMVAFVRKKQKEIMAAGILPSTLFEKIKGKTDSEIDNIIKETEEEICQKKTTN